MIVSRPWTAIEPGSKIIGRDGHTYLVISKIYAGAMAVVTLFGTPERPAPLATFALNAHEHVPVIEWTELDALACLARHFTLERIYR